MAKKSSDLYEGTVVFTNGVHYPTDEDGHPDYSRPLRAADGGGWRLAAEGEDLHNEVFHGRTVEIEPGTGGVA